MLPLFTGKYGLYGGGNASGINRLPDPEGAAYWQSRFDSGLKDDKLNDAFHGGIKNSDCAIAPTGGFCN